MTITRKPTEAENLTELRAEFSALFDNTISTWALADSATRGPIADALAGAAMEWFVRYESLMLADAEETAGPVACKATRYVN